MSILWGKDFVEVRTPRQLFEYSVMVDRQNAQNFVLLCSLDSALPEKSSFLLQLFCQGQANDLHKGANHSNIDGSRMNVQRDLACIARFQSRLRSLKYLWSTLPAASARKPHVMWLKFFYNLCCPKKLCFNFVVDMNHQNILTAAILVCCWFK